MATDKPIPTYYKGKAVIHVDPIESLGLLTKG